MKKVFFDTNVYNHLTEAQVEFLIMKKESKELDVLTMPQVLGELAGTFDSDAEEGKRLCRVYAKLISPRVINPPPFLLHDEVEYLLSGERHSIYLSREGKERFDSYLSSFLQGGIDDYTRQFISNMEQGKRKDKTLMRETCEELKPLWDNIQKSKYPTFESLYSQALRQGEIRNDIKGFLEKILVGPLGKAARLIEKKINKLPHMRIAIRLPYALLYWYNVKGMKPKWGDITDLLNFVALGKMEIFVSDDSMAREILLLIAPEKSAMGLPEFLSMIGD